MLRALGLGSLALGSLVTAGCSSSPSSPAGGDGRAPQGGNPKGPVPDPVNFLRTSWSTDPFALCSYSYLAPSEYGTDVRKMLAAPVAGRLHFAGEATSSDAPAMTHGALESGRRAALEIVKGSPGQSVLVVGSGFAGTGAARALADKGHQVTLLEGRARTGGRTWTARIADVPAEMGASWIHGSQRNSMTRVLDETHGRRYPFDYNNTIGVDNAAYRELARYQDELEDVAEPDNTAISAVFPSPLPPDLEYACNAQYSQEYGADIDQIAVSADDEGAPLRGGDLLLPDGYDQLLTHIRGTMNVRTNAEVTAVAYSPNGVTLTLKSGETVTADHAVITVPIGVLKANTITFDPPLPADKQNAIKALGAGLLDKLWLEFPNVFWNPDADVIEWYDHETPGRWSMWVNGHKAFGKPVLLGFNAGKRAHEFAHLSDQDVVASAIDTLRRMHS
jgi:monoamine oxidase